MALGAAVLRVAQNRKAHVGAMQPQLVGAAGNGGKGQQAPLAAPFQHPVMGLGGLAAGVYLPQKAGKGSAGDGGLDDASV